MQKWEYSRVWGNEIQYFTLDGLDRHQVKDKPNETSNAQRIAELGEQGWEMVGYDGDAHSYLFKRPKP